MSNSNLNLSKGTEVKENKFNLSKSKEPLNVESVQQPFSPNPKPKSKKWLWLVLILTVIVASAVYLTNNKTQEGNNAFASTENSFVNQSNNNSASQSPPDVATVNTGDSIVASKKERTNVENATNSEKSNGKVKEIKPIQEQQTQTNTVNESTSIEQKAIKVIRGDFGNGIDRRKALGSEYIAIQGKVNEMHKKGEF